MTTAHQPPSAWDCGTASPGCRNPPHEEDPTVEVTALTLGGLTGYNVVHSAPPSDALALLPIVLIPTASVPLLLALHIVSLRRLAAMSRARRPVAVRPALVDGVH